MKRKYWNSLFSIVLAAGAVMAQGPKGPGNGPGSGSGSNTGLDMSKQQVVEGTISSVQVAFGVQYPSIVVNKTQIKVAPVWYLLENDFELAAGEAVKVAAAPSNTAPDAYLYAVEITKMASGARITLRNEAGVPVWLAAARRGGNPQAPRTGGGCVDAGSIKTVTGTIDQVTSGVGIQHPTLVLKTSDSLLTFELGPERALLDNDLELKAGATLTVKYGLASCTDEFVALQLTDASGNTVVLRHDDGTPAWND